MVKVAITKIHYQSYMNSLTAYLWIESNYPGNAINPAYHPNHNIQLKIMNKWYFSL